MIVTRKPVLIASADRITGCLELCLTRQFVASSEPASWRLAGAPIIPADQELRCPIGFLVPELGECVVVTGHSVRHFLPALPPFCRRSTSHFLYKPSIHGRALRLRQNLATQPFGSDDAISAPRWSTCRIAYFLLVTISEAVGCYGGYCVYLSYSRIIPVEMRPRAPPAMMSAGRLHLRPNQEKPYDQPAFHDASCGVGVIT